MHVKEQMVRSHFSSSRKPIQVSGQEEDGSSHRKRGGQRDNLQPPSAILSNVKRRPPSFQTSLLRLYMGGVRIRSPLALSKSDKTSGAPYSLFKTRNRFTPGSVHALCQWIASSASNHVKPDPGTILSPKSSIS